MSLHAQGFVWTDVVILLGYVPRSGTAGSCGKANHVST